jgi:hypothetical protein
MCCNSAKAGELDPERLCIGVPAGLLRRRVRGFGRYDLAGSD